MESDRPMHTTSKMRYHSEMHRSISQQTDCGARIAEVMMRNPERRPTTRRLRLGTSAGIAVSSAAIFLAGCSGTVDGPNTNPGTGGTGHTSGGTAGAMPGVGGSSATGGSVGATGGSSTGGKGGSATGGTGGSAAGNAGGNAGMPTI